MPVEALLNVAEVVCLGTFVCKLVPASVVARHSAAARSRPGMGRRLFAGVDVAVPIAVGAVEDVGKTEWTSAAVDEPTIYARLVKLMSAWENAHFLWSEGGGRVKG